MAEWTTDRPTVEGSYWMKLRHAEPEIVRVAFDAGLGWWEVQTFGETFAHPLDRFDGALWLGPLEPQPLPHGKTK